MSDSVNKQLESASVKSLRATRSMRIPTTDDHTTYPVYAAGSVIYNSANDNLYVSDGTQYVVVGDGDTLQNLSSVMTEGALMAAGIDITTNGQNGFSFNGNARLYENLGVIVLESDIPIILQAENGNDYVLITSHLTGTNTTDTTITGSATLEADSSDIAGHVTGWDTTNPITINFSRPYLSKPIVVVTPATFATAGLSQIYVNSANTDQNGFEVACADNDDDVEFYYHVIGTI